MTNLDVVVSHAIIGIIGKFPFGGAALYAPLIPDVVERSINVYDVPLVVRNKYGPPTADLPPREIIVAVEFVAQ